MRSSVDLFCLQMPPRGRGYRYQPPRGTPDAGMAYDIGAMHMQQETPLPSVPVGALASLLANASPAEQRTVHPFHITLS